jgi:hypothetical protein
MNNPKMAALDAIVAKAGNAAKPGSSSMDPMDTAEEAAETCSHCGGKTEEYCVDCGKPVDSCDCAPAAA